MNFKAIRKLDTGLGRGGDVSIHRIALFPREPWSFQVIWGLEVEVASPTFLMELSLLQWVLANDLYCQLFSSYSRMQEALSWRCRMKRFYRGHHVCLNLLKLCDLGQVFWLL